MRRTFQHPFPRATQIRVLQSPIKIQELPKSKRLFKCCRFSLEDALTLPLCQLDDKHENSDADLQSQKSKEMKRGLEKQGQKSKTYLDYVNEDSSSLCLPLSINGHHQQGRNA